MATANQLRALLKSYGEKDDERFYSVALQLAVHEARLGHGKLARGRSRCDEVPGTARGEAHQPRRLPAAYPSVRGCALPKHV